MNPVSALPAAGLHYGVPYEDYSAWPAANFSRIKPIRQTASKCKYEIDHPKEPTAAMRLGSALHIATLEPARFEGMIHICPPSDGRTKEGKETLAIEREKAGDKIFIRSGNKDDEAALGEVGNLRGMADSIRSMKAAAMFLDGPGQNEVCALWKDAELDIWCKARFDRYIERLPAIVEIKSDRDASLFAFGKTADNRAYAAQAAGYLHGLQVITGKQAMHVFIAVENFPPFDAAVYTLDDKDLATGYRMYRQMLTRYAECLKTNHWPGYPDKVQVLSMPKYAHERDYAN